MGARQYSTVAAWKQRELQYTKNDVPTRRPALLDQDPEPQARPAMSEDVSCLALQY